MALELHQAFGEKLEILLFPCDQFGGQELPADQAAEFCVKKGLPNNAPGCKMFAKSDMNGPSTHPIWALAKAKFPGCGTCIERVACAYHLLIAHTESPVVSRVQ